MDERDRGTMVSERMREEGQTGAGTMTAGSQMGMAAGGTIGTAAGGITGWGVGMTWGMIAGLVTGMFLGMAISKVGRS
jgi:hypothetical protein